MRGWWVASWACVVACSSVGEVPDSGVDASSSDATIADASPEASLDAAVDAPACTAPDGSWLMVPDASDSLNAFLAQQLGVDCTGAYTTSIRTSPPQTVRIDKWNAADGASVWSTLVPPPDSGAPSTVLGAGIGGLYTSAVAATQLERRDPSTGAITWSVDDPSVSYFLDVAVGARPYTLGIVGADCRVDARSPDDGSIAWSVTIAGCSDARLRLGATALYLVDRTGSPQVVRIETTGQKGWSAPLPFAVADVAADATSVYLVGKALPLNASNYAWAVAQLDASSGAAGWSVTFRPTCSSPCNTSASTDVGASAVATSSGRLFVGGAQRWYTMPAWWEQWHLVELDPKNGNVMSDRLGPAGVEPAAPSRAEADSVSVYLFGSRENNSDFALGRWQ